MRRRRLAVPAVVGSVLAAAGIAQSVAGPAALGQAAPPPAASATKHVLLLSVDGMHQSDLTWYLAAHPTSALAKLVRRGTDYTNAQTTFPSDSFPGMIAQLTGATPGTAGVFYDDTYNHAYFPPGTTNCAAASPGTEIPWTEGIDRSQDPIMLDAGQGLSAPALTSLPTNTTQQTLAKSGAITKAILGMTPDPQTVIDPALLPVDPATCRPTYPHDYIRVNTVFDVAHAAGLRTAWSDKHPAYEILNGSGGSGIDDLFTPEINSVADSAGNDWTTDNALTQEYDNFKVSAVVNEIDGYDHSGQHKVGTPAVFGMNFQTVSTAQKLPMSDGLVGGYIDGQPGPLLTRALDYINNTVGRLTARLRHDGLLGSTAIILSAKHGQSPIDSSTLRRVDDGAIIDGVDAAWARTHPAAPPLVAFSVDDDVMLWWLSDRSPQAEHFARRYLQQHSAPANTITDPAGTFSTIVAHSGLTSIAIGTTAQRAVGARPGDAHAPDLVGIVRPGVVYTGKTTKIAEHGGASADDRDVPIVVAGIVGQRGVHSQPVLTTQIAPTILHLLGLDPSALDGVRVDGTAVLPTR